jgi:surfeit locus 1 family protein
MPSFTRPRPVAWFFFIAAFGTCVALGTWQVNRLAWKEGVIAALAEANTKEPITSLPADESELAALQFRKITLKGTWVEASHGTMDNASLAKKREAVDTEKTSAHKVHDVFEEAPSQAGSTPKRVSQGAVEFHLAPRYWRDQFGYSIITPFKLADDRVVMVNRGWVPAKKKDAATRPETAVKGRATINGLVRVGAERNYMSPPNQPEKNIWFGRDVAAMADSAKITNVIPVMVDIVGEQDAKRLPVPSDGTIRLRNDHLNYIITWYGIALGILVIFVVYHRKK